MYPTCAGKSNDDSLKNGLKDLATILRFVPRQGALQMRARSSMVVWLLIWLAPRLGIALPAENTYLLHFFMTVGPMGLLSSLS